jgi:hypothetical protein
MIGSPPRRRSSRPAAKNWSRLEVGTQDMSTELTKAQALATPYPGHWREDTLNHRFVFKRMDMDLNVFEIVWQGRDPR